MELRDNDLKISIITVHSFKEKYELEEESNGNYKN